MTKVKTENRQEFLNRLIGHFSEEDIALIEFAYDLAKESHRTQRRDTGERYFEHPRAGCLIIMDELGLYDRDMIIAFLLHDVGEDTPLFGNRNASYDKFVAQATFRLSRIFGSLVAHLVIGMTKPAVDNIRFVTEKEAYDFYIGNLSEDERIIIEKGVDRLHNLRSLATGKLPKIRRQIDETESVYIPIFSSVTGEMKQYADILVSKIKSEIQILKTHL